MMGMRVVMVTEGGEDRKGVELEFVVDLSGGLGDWKHHFLWQGEMQEGLE